MAATTFSAFKALASFKGYEVSPTVICAKGSVTDEIYLVEINEVSGALSSSATLASRSVVETVNHDFSVTSVGTGAFVNIATLTNDVLEWFIYNDTGYAFEFGISDTLVFFVPPGGCSLEHAVSSGDTIQLKCLDGTAATGRFLINGLA